MNKTEFIKVAREQHGVTARYSSNNNTMYLSGANAKEAKAALKNEGFELEVGFKPRVPRTEPEKNI